MTAPDDLRELTRAATRLPTFALSSPQRDDLELLQTGGYTPLIGFCTQGTVTAIRRTGRLPDGTPWPTPIVLTVPAGTASAATEAGQLALTDHDGTLLAVLDAEDRWDSDDGVHLGGPIRTVRTPPRWDFPELRQHGAELREEVARADGPVLCAQPTGPVDTASAARWSRAARQLGARLLVFPAVGGEPDRRHVARVRSYLALLDELPAGTLLRLLPSAHPPGRPGTTALHAVVARNAGATHLLVAVDGASADAAAVAGLHPVDPAAWAAPSDPPSGQFRPAVVRELRRGDPPRTERGLVVLLTGLSGAGKSTIANALRGHLLEVGDRQVTLLDGDLVRQHLSSELGFSQAHRDLNVRRIGFVASEIARHGGIAICAPIAPYDRTRRAVRQEVEAAGGGFVLVHVGTPLEVCEQRDVKGHYARARAGQLVGFTGIDDPYETPSDAEITIDTSVVAPRQAAATILDHLVRHGWIASP